MAKQKVTLKLRGLPAVKMKLAKVKARIGKRKA